MDKVSRRVAYDVFGNICLLAVGDPQFSVGDARFTVGDPRCTAAETLDSGGRGIRVLA